MTASLLKSPGLFSVFWPFSIMLLFGWSTLGRQLPNHPGPFNKPLVTVPKAPITNGIIVTFMFHSFFNSLARSMYLSLFSHSFSFILWSAGTAKSTIWQVFMIWSSGRDPFLCQSPIGVYVCHFLGQVLGCAYTICWHGLLLLLVC